MLISSCMNPIVNEPAFKVWIITYIQFKINLLFILSPTPESKYELELRVSSNDRLRHAVDCLDHGRNIKIVNMWVSRHLQPTIVLCGQHHLHTHSSAL